MGGQLVAPVDIREPQEVAPRRRLVEAYRRGDPLRVIANDFGGSVAGICDALIVETVPEDELERYRSVRGRGRAALGSIWESAEMATRLNRSGMGRSEIPVVLHALGKEIDVEVAVELLRIRWVPVYDPTILSQPIRLSDKLALLYVIGKRHGIEPDYQLALGQIPADEVIELRLLTKSRFPPRRFAEILATAETTKLAVRARLATSLSVADYDATANHLSRRLRDYISEGTAPWPPPAPTLVRRLGAGSWEQALNTVGLKLNTAADRLGLDEFDPALHDFAEECADSDFPLTLEVYDRWVTAETALDGNRPSALEVIDHYGGWDEALSQVLDYQGNEGLEQRSKSLLRYAPFLEGKDAAVEAAWVRAGEYIAELLAHMPRNRALHVQYGDAGGAALRPYAEGTRGPEGIWCEIVSERLLPADRWPIVVDLLKSEHWIAPDDEFPNWCKEKVPLHEAGHQLLRGLRYGRLCPDPWQLRWGTRQPLNGPGRDHGVTLEDALAGETQTLRNAG